MKTDELTIPFNPWALIRMEQEIIKILLSSDSALNGFQVYYRILQRLFRALPFPERDRVLRDMPIGEKPLRKFIKKLKEKHKTIFFVGFPDYRKIIRALDAMVAAGWVKKRTAHLRRAKSVYFLDEKMRKKLKDAGISTIPQHYINYKPDEIAIIKTRKQTAEEIWKKQCSNVPCAIHYGKRCKMSFCRFMHYSKLSQEAFSEWMEKVRRELREN